MSSVVGRLMSLVVVVGLVACSGSSSPPPEAVVQDGSAPRGDATPPGPSPAPAARPSLTEETCLEQGGSVVGDIGDGAVHRPDYVCPSGQPPIGSIVTGAGEPIGVEGAVCCAK